MLLLATIAMKRGRRRPKRANKARMQRKVAKNKKKWRMMSKKSKKSRRSKRLLKMRISKKRVCLTHSVLYIAQNAVYHLSIVSLETNLKLFRSVRKHWRQATPRYLASCTQKLLRMKNQRQVSHPNNSRSKRKKSALLQRRTKRLESSR